MEAGDVKTWPYQDNEEEEEEIADGPGIFFFSYSSFSEYMPSVSALSAGAEKVLGGVVNNAQAFTRVLAMKEISP